MNENKQNWIKQLITKIYVIPALVLSVNGATLLAVQPDWWTDYSLTDGTARRDDAVATVGQAKHAVQKAYQYLEAELATVGGAGTDVTELHDSYCAMAPVDPDDDLRSLTLGQLKYLAKPFYDRLNSAEVGFDTRAMNPASIDIYPWTLTQTDDNDRALATLGQLKFVFSFDLIAMNQIPEAPELTVIVLEGGSVVIDLLTNATDEDGDSLSLASVFEPDNGILQDNGDGTVTYTHNGTETLADSFTYTVTDGFSNSEPADVLITINPVNDAPVINNEHLTTIVENNLYSYTINATDPDVGDTVTIAVPVLPDWLRFNGATLSGAPGYEDVGYHTIVITASDLSGATVEESFVITVYSANDAPYILSDAIETADVDSLYSYSVIATDPDMDDTVTLSVSVLPDWLSFDGVTLSGTPGDADVGQHLVGVVATDLQGATDVQSFVITVIGSPEITSNPDRFMHEGTAYNYTITATDPDVDDTVTITVPELPDWLRFDGATLSGVPSYNETGNHNVKVVATDSKGATDTQEFTISVALLDADGDHLSDNWEIQWFEDLAEGGVGDDYDLDGMDNLEEFQNGLNPTLDDSMQDSDGDGYPNVYETLGTNGDLNDPAIAPEADYTVTVDGSSGYATLQSAIDAATDDYSIILVEPGVYTGAGNPDFIINNDDPSILIISENGAGSAVLDGEGVNRGGSIYNDRSALVGLDIKNCFGDYDGGGLYIQGDEVLVANCSVHNNTLTGYYPTGGGIYIGGDFEFTLNQNEDILMLDPLGRILSPDNFDLKVSLEIGGKVVATVDVPVEISTEQTSGSDTYSQWYGDQNTGGVVLVRVFFPIQLDETYVNVKYGNLVHKGRTNYLYYSYFESNFVGVGPGWGQPTMNVGHRYVGAEQEYPIGMTVPSAIVGPNTQPFEARTNKWVDEDYMNDLSYGEGLVNLIFSGMNGPVPWIPPLDRTVESPDQNL